jgi:hypothetical protein
VSTGKQLPTLRRVVLTSPSRSNSPLVKLGFNFQLAVQNVFPFFEKKNGNLEKSKTCVKVLKGIKFVIDFPWNVG